MASNCGIIYIWPARVLRELHTGNEILKTERTLLHTLNFRLTNLYTHTVMPVLRFDKVDMQQGITDKERLIILRIREMYIIQACQ